jgi:hypothetical protein
VTVAGHVSVFGPSRLVVAGEVVACTAQDLKVLTTLALFGNDGTDTAVVERMAWLRRPSARAVHSSVYRLRQLLGADAIVSSRRSLGLNSDVVDNDLLVLQRAEQHVASGGSDRLTAFRIVVDTLRGTAFETMAPHPSWVAPRAKWTERVERLRDALIDDDVSVGKLERALRNTEAQLKLTPTATHRWIRAVRLHAMKGAPNEALNTAERANDVLRQHGLPRDAVINQLREQLLMGMPLPNERAPRMPPQRTFVDGERWEDVDAFVAGRTTERIMMVVGPACSSRVALLAAADGSHPGVRVVDNVNLLDPAEQVALVDQAERLQHRLLLGCSSMNGFDSHALGGRPALIIHLSPLPADEVRRRLATAGLTSDAAAEAAAVTGGWPALVGRMVGSMHRRQPFDAACDEMVTLRLAWMSADAQRATRIVALLNVPLDLAAARTAAGGERWLTCGLEEAGEAMMINLTERQGTMSSDVAKIVVRLTPPAERTATAAMLLGVWQPQPDSPLQLLCAARLHLFADPADGWSKAQQLLRSAFAHGAPHLGVAGEAVRLLGGLGQLPVNEYARLLLAYGTELQLEDPEAAVAVFDDAYRRVRSLRDRNECIALVARLTESNLVINASDDGEYAFQLATSWLEELREPGAETALLMAVVAMHQMARHDLCTGVAMAHRALAMTEALDDQVLRRRVLRLLTADGSWCRELVDAASELRDVACVDGHLGRVTVADLYIGCAAVRQQNATFDATQFSELLASGLNSESAAVQFRALALQGMVAATRVDAATYAIVGDRLSKVSEHVKWSPMIEVVRFAQRLTSTPHWQRLPADELVGNPVSWRVRSGLDIELYRAARAARRGQRARAGHMLDAIGRSVVDPPGSVLWPTRLPVLALTARAVGDRELAGRLLHQHLPARRLDLSMLPAFYLGPASAWLALLADTARDPLAHVLHSEAAHRWEQVGGRVMELA